MAHKWDYLTCVGSGSTTEDAVRDLAGRLGELLARGWQHVDTEPVKESATGDFTVRAKLRKAHNRTWSRVDPAT
jgi:hypothetical protein